MKLNLKATMNPDPTPDPAHLLSPDLCVDVLIPAEAWHRGCSDPARLCECAVRVGFDLAVADGADIKADSAEVAIMLTSDQHVQNLNRDYRGIDRPTNVLSFACLDDGAMAGQPAGVAVMLGDIVIAFETVQREAEDEGRSLEDHLSHMVAHGLLHLMGYDHHNDSDAIHMEKLEVRILKQLGVSDPYIGREPGQQPGTT